jgi:hypothetical protein
MFARESVQAELILDLDSILYLSGLKVKITLKHLAQFYSKKQHMILDENQKVKIP